MMARVREYIISTVLILLSASFSYAQESKDTEKEGDGNNSAMFLNASSDSKPRQISLGLPTKSGGSVQIFEDGLPVSYYNYQLQPHKSWHAGVSASSTGTMSPSESALRYGEINYFAESTSRYGSDSFRGSLSYTLGSYGQNKIDLNVSGPIAAGWQYSLSTYQNIDPGSNHIINPKFKDRHQFYKGALSKSFSDGSGHMAMLYQYVHYATLNESNGPFIFVGDGSVKPYDGFKLGTDSYWPSETRLEYLDFMTGEHVVTTFRDGCKDEANTLSFILDKMLGNGVHLDVRSRLKWGTSFRSNGSLGGIERAGEGTGYSLLDGTPYVGMVQKRSILHFDAFEESWMNNAELSGRTGNHAWRAGADLWFNHGGTITSSVIAAHEVRKDPRQLLFKGDRFFNFNTSAEYYDGNETKAALYVKDSWQVSRRLSLGAFIRAEYHSIGGKAANNIGDDTSNTRYAGFTLKQGKITDFAENYLNGAFGGELAYDLGSGWSFQADGTFTRIHSNIFNYGGYHYPDRKPTDTYLLRAGLAYGNSWLSLLSQVNYISQTNNNSRAVFHHILVKPVGDKPAGYAESMALPMVYGIYSLGWVTDATINTGSGFSLHMQLALRDPRYKDFTFTPVFPDGVSDTYDFSGNVPANVQKVEFSFDPSYTAGPWRLWLSGRYLSKSYINKTNSLYFKGRVETFGGADYKINDKVRLSLNVINILNQKGASGSIGSADLVSDTSAFTNYLMAGAYIRPFTVELGVKVDF